MRRVLVLSLLVAACVPPEPDATSEAQRKRCPHIYGVFLDDPTCVPPRRGGDGGGKRSFIIGPEEPEDPGTGGGGT